MQCNDVTYKRDEKLDAQTNTADALFAIANELRRLANGLQGQGEPSLARSVVFLTQAINENFCKDNETIHQ